MEWEPGWDERQNGKEKSTFQPLITNMEHTLQGIEETIKKARNEGKQTSYTRTGTCMCRSLSSMLLGAGLLVVPDLPRTG